MNGVFARFRLSLIVGLAVALPGWATAGDRAPSSAEDPVSVPGAKSAVLVELFTSQGCSSCPSADRFLTELAAREDIEIIPLSFHVDYWNYIGWTDPFSSSAWSDRQRRYGKAFGGNRIYTPQMVVSGRWEAVGSNRREIARYLERASAEPRAAEMSVSAELVSDDRLRVAVEVKRFDSVLRGKRLAAWVAVVESDLETPVGRGENASKTLHNDAVVRILEEVSELGPVKLGDRGSLEISLGNGWRRSQLSVVTFLQDADSLRILAAAECGLVDSRQAPASGS